MPLVACLCCVVPISQCVPVVSQEGPHPVTHIPQARTGTSSVGVGEGVVELRVGEAEGQQQRGRGAGRGGVGLTHG
jgi:hypothetical protein